MTIIQLIIALVILGILYVRMIQREVPRSIAENILFVDMPSGQKREAFADRELVLGMNIVLLSGIGN